MSSAIQSAAPARTSLRLLVFDSVGDRPDYRNQLEQAGLSDWFASISNPDSAEDELHSRPYDLVLWRITSAQQEFAKLDGFLHRVQSVAPLIVVASVEIRGSATEDRLLELVGREISDFCFDDEPAVLSRIVRRIVAERTQPDQSGPEFLRTPEALLALVEACPLAVVALTSRGKVSLWNRSAEKIYGWRREEVLGKPLPTIPASAEHEFRELLESQLHGVSYAGKEVQRLCKGGKLIDVSLWTAPLRDERGRIRAKLAISADITERRSVERERFELEVKNAEIEQANRLKSEFLASMSHELRTPLHTIIGFSQLLAEELEGPLSPKQKRFVGHILRDSQHLVDLINGILDISKIEAGKLELHPENFNAIDATNEVVDSIASLAATKSIAIEKNLCEPFAMRGDRVRFKQILYNLLSNAVKFTPESGKVSIECSTEDGWAQFCISDSGVGIPKNLQAAIFDKFYQVGSTTKGEQEGTGLGLPITKHLVEQHGGRIWLESKPGSGSRFYFRLPL